MRQGPSGPAGFDYIAIKLVADTYEMVWNADLLDKIKLVEQELLSYYTPIETENVDDE